MCSSIMIKELLYIYNNEEVPFLKISRLFFIVIFSTLLIIFSGCSSEKSGRPIEDFEFTNQNGEKVSLNDLKGDVLVADFVFTNCTTVCPPMTSNMTELQKRVEEAGYDDVTFVSFSVDPELDTPEVLKEYAKDYGINLDNWEFLTGYSQEEIEKFAEKNFKTIVKKPENDDQVIHGTSFYVINKDGEIVEEFQGNTDVPFYEIMSVGKSFR